MVLIAVTANTITFTVDEFVVAPVCRSASRLCMLSGDASVADLTSVRANADLAGSCVIMMGKHPILSRIVRGLGLGRDCGALNNEIALSGPSGSQMLGVAMASPSPRVTGAVTSRVTGITSTCVTRGVGRSPPAVVRDKCSSKNTMDPGVNGGAIVKTFTKTFLSVTIVIISCLFGSAVVSARSIRGGLNVGMLNALPLSRSRSSKRRKGNEGRNENDREGGEGGGSTSTWKDLCRRVNE